MKACAFFGHRRYGYEGCREIIKSSIVDLIENYGVTQFYSGGRGEFDNLCSSIVYELKKEYPHIKNTLVLSYLPVKKEEYGLPEKYDDSAYFLENRVPPRFAIVKTNEEMIKHTDFVLSGVVWRRGGAYQACEYARRKGKKVIFILQKENKG